LDLVVRVDMKRVREALGAQAESRLVAQVPASTGRRDATRLLRAALQRADTVWLALRLGLPFEQMDNVLVLQGSFSGLDPRDSAPSDWGTPMDLGGAWRVYEALQTKTRAGPARLYARGEALWVVVSGAEIDSFERCVHNPSTPDKLEPEERGIISLSSRLRPLAAELQERAPAAARLLSKAVTLRASAEIVAQTVSAELAIEFRDAAQASEAAQASKVLAELFKSPGNQPHPTLAQLVAESTQIEAVAETLVIRLKIPAEAIGQLSR
jgi:hypothetical protein